MNNISDYSPLKPFDEKINKNLAFSDQELVQLGKILQPLFEQNSWTNYFFGDSEATLRDRAKDYIKFRKQNPTLEDVTQRMQASAEPVMQTHLSSPTRLERRLEMERPEFLKKLNSKLPSDQIRVLDHAYQSYPLVREGLQYLPVSDDLLFQTTMTNVMLLIDHLNSVQGASELALMDELKPIFKGERNFNLIDTPQAIQKEIQRVQTPVPKAPFPLNPVVLQKEVDLREAVSISKEKLPRLMQPLGTSVNAVFRLEAVHFKEGGPQGIMESYIWRMAEVLGASEHFAGTKVTTIQTKKGGAQKTIVGQLFKDWEKTQAPKISDIDLIKAMAVSLCFGFFDAHSANMFVTPEGKICFFDNTRSFPHTNGVHNRGDHLFPSFRSTLFYHERFKNPLFSKLREQFKDEIDHYQSRLDALEKWMNSSQSKQMLKQLPPNWFDKDLVLSATKQRLERIQKALKNPKIISMEDFVLAAHPEMKFFAAALIAAYAREYFSSPITLTSDDVVRMIREVMANRGVRDLSFYLKHAAGLGFDPNKIEMCAIGESLEAIILKLRREYDYLLYDFSLKPARAQQKIIEERKNAVQPLLENRFGDFPLDLKDVSLDECNKYYLSKFKEAFVKAKLIPPIQMAAGYFKENSSAGDTLFIQDPKSSPEDPKIYFVKKLESGEVQQILLDWKKNIGKVTLDTGEVLTLDQFKQRV